MQIEYAVELTSRHIKNPETKSTIRNPYKTESEARAAYERERLGAIAEDLERTEKDGVTVVAKRLLKVSAGKPDEELDGDEYNVEPVKP
jgi:hypothetical protein